MITCTLNGKKYAVDFITGRALREMEPAAKMYSRIVALSSAALKGETPEDAKELSIGEAMDAVEHEPSPPVPAHLQDSHYSGAQKLGHGNGYRSPHDYPGHYVKQQYLPDGMEDRKFYHVSDQGYEAQIRRYLDSLKE